MTNPHRGSEFEDFLAEEGILEECSTAAIKFMVAHELHQKMEREKLSKSEVARRLHTSRSGVDRILDASNTSITLDTLGRVVGLLGKRLEVNILKVR